MAKLIRAGHLCARYKTPRRGGQLAQLQYVHDSALQPSRSKNHRMWKVLAIDRSMASRGRGSANNGATAVVGAAAVLMIAFLVMSAAPLAEAARYTVGDSGGWRFYAEGWAKGKTFRAGDVLEFKYNAAVHDVAAVDLAAYRSCTVPKGVRKMRSGHDKVTLHKGTHYFICTEPGHCKAGMKLAVRAV